MHPRIKFSLIIFGGILSSLIGICIVTYISIRSPAGSKIILNKIQSQLLEKTQIKMTFSTASVDPFSGVSIENLHLNRSSPSEPVDIQIKTIDVRYQLSLRSLLTRSIELTRFQIEQPHVLFHGSFLQPASKTQTSSSDQAALFIASRLQFKLKNFAIHHLNLDLDVRLPGTQFNAQLKEANASLDLEWRSNRLAAKGDFSALESNHFQASFSENKKVTQIQASPTASGQWAGELRWENSHWVYELFPSHLQAGIKEFKIEHTENGQIQISGTNLESETGVQIREDLNLQFKLKGDLLVQSQIGKVRAQTEMKAQLQAPQSDALVSLQKVKMDLSGNTRLESQLRGLPLSIPAPVSIQHQANFQQGKARLQAQAIIPLVQLESKGKIKDTEISLSLEGVGQPGELARNFDATLLLKQAKLQLSQIPPLSGIQAKLVAAIRDGNRFNLSELSGEAYEVHHHPIVKLSAEASGDSKAHHFQSQGTLSMELPHGFPAVQGHHVEGQAKFPWSLAISQGREIRFEGMVDIPELSWSKEPTPKSPSSFHIKNLAGKIPVSEQLTWANGKLQFSEIIAQNPFERVDFERFLPMIQESEPFSIEHLGFNEKVYGPFQGYFSVRQNMIFAHKFDLNLGSGKAYGELFLDTSPASLKLGLLARATGINLSETLPKKYLVKTSTGNERISGRSGMVININDGSIDGRIDITEIGKNQLITLINVLDPRFEDIQMNRARFALGIASPSAIQMAFQKGYMDLGFTLQSPLNQDFLFRGIPIYSWIAGARAGFIKKTPGGPSK